MNILFLAHRIPFPPNKGDKIRSFHLLQSLHEKGQVFLGTLLDDPRDRQHVDILRERFASVFAVENFSKIKRYLSAGEHLRNKPASVGFFYDRSLQNWVDDVLSQKRIDLVFCFSSTMAEYLFRSREWPKLKESGVRLLMDFCDVDSQKWLDYGAIKSWPFSSFFRQEGRLLMGYERRVAECFDYCFLASSREKDLFDQLHEAHNVGVLENGVALEFFTNRHMEPDGKFDTGPKVVFTGAMDYDVNIDGVCWFVDVIWPAIRSQVEDAKFYIVGSNPVPQIEKLGIRDDIEVTGFVEDIREYYEMATVCVAPLRVARGIQNKVLEAMAMSKAVVCTPNAFEGISAQPGRDLVVVDDPDEFSSAVISVLKDQDQRAQIEKAGRECMERNYCWQQKLKKLEAFLSLLAFVAIFQVS